MTDQPKMVQVLIPKDHWTQIVINVEKHAGMGSEDIEILQNAIVNDLEPFPEEHDHEFETVCVICGTRASDYFLVTNPEAFDA